MGEATIGYLPGVWDLLHVGHMRAMSRANLFCDQLVVGVCSDMCVEHTKGRLPVVCERERLEMVRGIKGVHAALIYEHMDQSELLRELMPGVFFCGPDYGQDGRQVATLDACGDIGIRVVTLPRTEGISTTDRLRRIRTGP